MKKKKTGFIIKLIPGNHDSQIKIMTSLTVLFFLMSVFTLTLTVEKFYNTEKAEAFAERVNNTRAK